MSIKDPKQILEDATKSQQTAALLLSDLQSLNSRGDPVVSLLVMPEIETIAKSSNRLTELVFALEERVRMADRDKPRLR